MVATDTPTLPAPSRHRRVDEETEPGRPGLVGRWIRRDPVRAAAIGMIALQLLVRADVASRGFLAADDYVLTSISAVSELDSNLLLGVYANHLMPAVMLLTWLITRSLGFVYWPYLLILLALQVAVSYMFYRLLRQLIAARWGLLIPLAVFLFCPLSLEHSSWWWSGANVLPMELAMIVAIYAQVRYAQTRRPYHLVTLGVALIFGLAFFEKSLLIAPLVFLFTACLLVRGGILRSLWRALLGFWPSWLVLTAIGSAYLVLYFSLTKPLTQGPASIPEVLTFVRHLVGANLIPGLLGGPWFWLDVGDGAPLSAPNDIGRWLSWLAFLTIIVATIALRRSAVRAWVLLAGHVALVVALLALTRLGLVFSAAAGLVPRYVTEVVATAAICLGVAMFGLRGQENDRRATSLTTGWRRVLAEPGVVSGITVVSIVATIGVGLGTAWSTARFSEDWAAKQGRDYIKAAQADLAKAPPGTVFFDFTVPVGVLPPLYDPYHFQSKFLQPLKDDPTFVTVSETPSMFDDFGHVRPLDVAGPTTQPGPEPGCGHKVERGNTAVLGLTGDRFDWFWVVKIGYLSSGDAPAVLRLGKGERWFEVKRGLHEVYFMIVGGGNLIRLTVDDPNVTLCVDKITIGGAVPKQ
jgi:hypothetical protein